MKKIWPKGLTSKAVGVLTVIALTTGCGAQVTSQTESSVSSTATSTTTSSSTTTNTSTGTVWTTISSAVREASTGASASEILAANTDTSETTDAITSDDEAGTWDASSATTITGSGSSATVSGDNASAVSVDGSTITITGAGTFVVSGTLDDGQIIVAAADADVHLVLNGVTITNSDGPAIQVDDAGSMTTVLAEGSTNTLTDGASYADTSDTAPTAAFFSSDNMAITGTGSLTVTGQYQDGISSKNGLVITGEVDITVNAADDGIRGKDYLVVDGGATLTVTAGGDGLKSTEDTDETAGFVALKDAQITITSGDDGVDATTDVTVEGTTLEVTAGGGQSQASPSTGGGQRPGQTTESTDTTTSPKGISAAVAYSQDSGTVLLDTADEGVQAAFVTITGGDLTVTAGDDAINTSNGDLVIEGYENADSEADDGSTLTMTGGSLQASYAGSDGLDSNGSASITGGTAVIQGSTGSMDGAVDVNGDLTMAGLSTQLSVSAGDTITVSGSDGSSWSGTAAFSASTITVVGLSEGVSYTITSGSSSATATASAISQAAGMQQGQGGMAPGGMAPGGRGA